MSLGKLVREKMKLQKSDFSGEYIDHVGKHFTMSASNDGYTVSYGGEKKREISITKDQGIKLAGACRKLNLSDINEKK